jgi:hypothetical protein
MRAMPAEKVALRIRNVAKAVLVTGQAYQDPKDALNEFVSNAADEYAEAGLRGERIRIVLRRRGQRPFLAVSDDGRGMGGERLKAIAQGLFESTKAGDERTIGEKAIGILAFQQLGERCEIVSRAEGSQRTSSLRLERGRRHAFLEPNERRRRRDTVGTTVYILDLDPDVLRVLTQRKVVDYLRRRRGPALARGDYTITVEEGRSVELVTPEEPDGVRVPIPAQATLWGRVEFSLYVAARPDRHRRVAVVGRAGTTIIDDIAELDEFDHLPWTSDQVSGSASFEALQSSSGRRAILRDRTAFPLFVSAVSAVEPLVATTLERVARAVDEEQAERLADIVRRIFGRVLKELADLDNPMRTPLGSVEGDGGLLAEASPSTNGSGRAREDTAADELPALPEPVGEPPEPLDVQLARPDRGRSRALPTVAPDAAPGEARSRFDADAGVVLYNDTHPDYLLVKDDETQLLDYLATLVAKEYVVYNNPRSTPDELGEEMVRMLVRVRRHMGRRR